MCTHRVFREKFNRMFSIRIRPLHLHSTSRRDRRVCTSFATVDLVDQDYDTVCRDVIVY